MAADRQAQKEARSIAIKKCRCANAYQDKKYGKKMRVHNRTQQKSDKSLQGWRCTVCKDVKS